MTAPATKHVRTYYSVAAMLAACDGAVAAGRAEPQKDVADYRQVGRRFRGWNEARAAAESPWQDGLDILQEMIFEVDRERIEVPAALDVRRRRRWAADDGDEVCLDRLRAGQDAWQSTARVAVNHPRQVTIFANVSASAGVSHDAILWRGAAAICLADLLEKQGYRVELWACEYGRSLHMDNQYSLDAAKLKGMAEPLDISTIVNSLSGWFFRTVFFQASHVPALPVCPAAGRHANLTADVDAIAALARGSYPIVMDGIFSRDAALALIRKTVAALAA